MTVSYTSKFLVVLGLLAAGPFMQHVSSARREPATNALVAQSRASAAYVVPPGFEPNQGQADPQVKFVSRGRGYLLFLGATETVLSLRNESDPSRQPLTLRMTLAGANPAPRITGEGDLPGRSNYFRGNDKKTWHTDIPSYARVRYENVYPGVDLVYYHNGHDLEYDFIVAAGADPSQIRLAFSGADSVLSADGDLVLRAGAAEIRQTKPVIYQEVNGVRRTISGGYLLTDSHQVRFNLGAYDPAHPLVIDPVLAYSTYFGGTSDDVGWDIAVDANRNAYVAGSRPSVRASQDYDAFVAKFSPSGVLLWVADVGDTCDDQGRGIALDAGGNIYVTGQIGGICYPYPTLTAGAFVAKLNANGGLRYMFPFSSEWSSADIGQAVAVDAAGNAYVGGVTSSMYFPTTPGAFQQQYNGWYGDGFVVKVNAAGTARVYATFFGGTGHESLNDIAVDASGNAYVTGSTTSRDLPTTLNAFQRTHNGWGPMASSAFVSKLNATGSGLIFSTYLGGRYDDAAMGIAIDAARAVYVTGNATSDNFPTTAGVVQRWMAAQPLCDAAWEFCTDAFVTKLNAAGTALVYSTYLGGNLTDAANGIAVDAAGNAHVTGQTWSTTFPAVRPFQPATAGFMDAFVTKLNATATALVYSSYLGGTKMSDTFSEGEDAGLRIAVDADGGSAYVAGLTRSPNFPVTPGAHQPLLGGGLCGYYNYRCSDAFVARISDTPQAPVRNYSYAGPAVAIPDNQPAGVQIPITVANVAGTIGDLNVRFDGNVCTNMAGATTVGLNHTWVGDLAMTLTSPRGTTVTLMNRPGGPNNAGDNFCQTLLDDDGGVLSIQNITAVGAPYGGAFRPAIPLAAFRGENPNGTWCCG